MMTEEMDEYQKRLVPASDEEIIDLAKVIWSDPLLRLAFERAGYDGDLTSVEQELVEGAIAIYRQGPLWDRDGLHLALAPCLLRRLVAGMIDDLDSADVRSFLEDRRVIRVGPGMKPVPCSPEEEMELARAMRASPETWTVFQEAEIHQHAKRDISLSDEQAGVLNSFQNNFRLKMGYLNRHRFTGTYDLLRQVAAGKFALESSEALAYLKTR